MEPLYLLRMCVWTDRTAVLSTDKAKTDESRLYYPLSELKFNAFIPPLCGSSNSESLAKGFSFLSETEKNQFVIHIIMIHVSELI